MPVVQLLHTCLVNEFAPQIGFSVVRVLERLGYTVEVPADQTCCGQPPFNAGFQDQARVAAQHTITVLEATEGPIIIPSGSCGDMVVHQFAELFRAGTRSRSEPAETVPAGGWGDRAHAVASRCREFSAFVADHLHLLPVTRRLDTAVAYHPSCHLMRGLGIDREPRAVIAAVEGARMVDLSNGDECCGFGGLFSVKHPEISGRMLDHKLASVEASGADRLVSCDLGCLLHMGGGLHRRGSPVKVQHLAELLDEWLS
jgi:L-lactate dehydrogenase complex protein LldE